MLSEKVEEEIMMTDTSSLNQIIMNKIRKAKKLLKELKEGYANLLPTFDSGQKLISIQMKINENLNQLTSQLDQIGETQSETYAKIAKSAQRNKIVGVIGTIIGITGITLALLAYLLP